MATLEQVFQREKAWIAQCDDVDALIEKIGDWRDSRREAERDGDQLVRMRDGDLVKLARSRVVRLQAGTMREEAVSAPVKEVAPKVEERGVQPRVAEPVRAPERSARRPEPESRPAHWKVDDEATRAATAKAQADARIAAAEATRRELENQLLSAQVKAAQRASAAPVAATAARKPAEASQGTATRMSPPMSAAAPVNSAVNPSRGGDRHPALKTARPLDPPVAAARKGKAPAPTEPTHSPEDQLALMSAGRWPTSGPPPGHRFYSRDQDWPAEWTLTGLDLARFRGGLHVTQRVLAAQLGVATAAIAELERRPREKVGPAMQIALRRAMDGVAAQARRRREQAAVASVPGHGTPAALPTSTAPRSRAVPVSSPASAVTAPGVPLGFTGADLARLRADRKLSQRQFAQLLGVGHGMVAKAEVAAEEPLGERMRAAVGALLAAGTASPPS